jgi:cytochrome c peroxidase
VSAAAALDFSAAERAAIRSHGPWPHPEASDSSNRVQGDPAAAALGQRLFFDPRLSANGSVSCASCHRPAQHYQDGRPTARGLGAGTRNTPSVLDLGGQRWFGWDGASDSLWAASLRALAQPHEMGGSAAAVAALLRSDPDLGDRYRQAFGHAPGPDDEVIWVDAAKALAAWQATLVSPRTAFDAFRDALARGDEAGVARYPAAAQRGLRLFVGEARCGTCHAGPRFTNGEFADIGLPFFLPGGGVDPGRHGGLRALQASPYNRLGRFADDGGAGAVATRHVQITHRNFGEFRVPTLRGLVHTAPYMHDGRLATLDDVLRHYDRIDEERLHADGERILRPLGLTDAERADLRAFLLSLSGRVPEPGYVLPARGGKREN